ncbi:sigma-70 family RNA polymerase sigma factor [Neobacillus niacini]|uniref:sigma-70 family RNA polymerase sigma factor n=1 Tax=Neobacillus niacini TaxID=86668 RepID=UPI0021CB45C2|nr:sigma-70 family RNA polymerase sigma factor [Neobacillus niacini]MCM3766808.1 sigma-70 family RNA polymerase sigma factor [Neobacillus niacini]
MIPAKIDPISITTIREKGMESIIDWFGHHKESFYALGWSYFRSQRQMEELFYQTILKVYKEFPRFKNVTTFETWVTSIFINTCHELHEDRSLQASEESEQHKDLFKAFDQLKKHEKEAMALTYIKGLSREDAAQLLRVSAEEMKVHMFSGIQTLRKEMGYRPTLNGCSEYHNDYFDYLEGTLERSKKVALEIHIYHCQHCQEDLASLQEIMLTLSSVTEKMADFHVPSDFMGNVKARLAEKERQRQLKFKKRKRMGFVLAGVIALLIGIEVIAGTFSNLYYTWTEEDQELRAFLQQDLGERLDLVAESDGVKIKIKSAVADHVQTLVFYEIEDTATDNQYVMHYNDGVFVENEHEIMSREMFPRYYPLDLESDVNKDKKNVYQGKMSLLPLTSDKGTIKLQITKLQKLIRNSSDSNGINPYENIDFKTGEWNFEIPVTKQPAIEYALDEEAEIEGIPVRFNKLILAPTATILQFGINHEQPEKRIDVINFDNLEVNNKIVKADRYGSLFMNPELDMNWIAFQAYFDPLYGEKPKQVNIQLKSAQLTVEDRKTVELDASKDYPQTLEYAGSTITLEKVEIGQPANIVISDREVENRAFELLNFNILGEDENENSSMEMEQEGVLVDKSGKKYDINERHFPFEEIEQPRYFFTVQNIRMHSNNPGEDVIPKWLEIYGYNTTKYLDDVVKISVE